MLEMDGKWSTDSDRNLSSRKSGNTVLEKRLYSWQDEWKCNLSWLGWNQALLKSNYIQKVVHAEIFFLIVWKLFAIVGLHDNSIIWNNPTSDSQHEALLYADVLASILENVRNGRERAIETTKAL